MSISCPPPRMRRRRRAEEEEEEEVQAVHVEARPAEDGRQHGLQQRPGPAGPDFHEFCLRLQQSAGPSTGSSLSKAEAQVAKVVRMVRRQLPNYPEAEIQRHVDEVRRSQGGFSRMTLNAIVAAVLSHVESANSKTT